MATFSVEHPFLMIFAVFHAVILLVVLSNLMFAPRIKRGKRKSGSCPAVSVLVPARNEENAIRACLESILGQTYDNFTVTVLDDESTDATGAILRQMAEKEPGLKIIQGRPLPLGWTGKNRACDQLARSAEGDLLLFIDSDCLLAEWAIEASVYRMERHGLDLLSCFPTQILSSWQERLIVPLMDWLLLAFLPLRLVYSSPWRPFVAANGQFMLFRKKAYLDTGGHSGVRDRVVEDMELARKIRGSRMRMMTALGGRGVYCRMYDSFSASFQGFSKNFYPGFNTGPAAFIMMLLFFEAAFLLPFLIALADPYFAVIAGTVLLQRMLLSVTDRQNPLINALLHPVHMAVLLVTGINSLIQTRRGTLTWKGRKLHRA